MQDALAVGDPENHIQPSRWMACASLAAMPVSGLLGALLASAAVSKALFPSDTFETLEYATSIAIGGSAAFSVVLIVLAVLIACEWGIGILLVAQWRPTWIAACAAGLFAIFAVFVLWLALTRAPVGCGCRILDNSALASFSDVLRSGAFLLLSAGLLAIRAVLAFQARHAS